MNDEGKEPYIRTPKNTINYYAIDISTNSRIFVHFIKS